MTLSTTGMLSRAWGAIHLGSMNQWPQTTLFNHVLRLPVGGQDFTEATTPTTPSTAKEDMTGCTSLPPRTERENWYLFVVTASVGQLNLGPDGNGPKGSRAEITFQNLRMAATFPGSTKAISYEGTPIKELDE